MADSSSFLDSGNAANSLPKTYDPAGTESRWQTLWEETNAFHPDPNAPGDSFSVVIPPPNVTGSLHMGHAFNTALIDTIVRYQRINGKNVLCLPGTDHASIAVQTILEKQLKIENISKDDLGRNAFLKRAWAWKSDSGERITSQLRRLGYSVDWQRQRFTLDEKLSESVTEAFIRLYKEGLIYRGEYLVNWCPASGSAVSDLEVEMKEVDGFLWHFRYPIVDDTTGAKGETFLEVATTRPETMLGDVAVAVNPLDQRYIHLVGKKLQLPLVERQIPVISDEHVDLNFGTGCVKVTPAHDPNDFAIGKRHGLPQITIMNKDGSMNEHAGPFEGLDRFVARQEVVKALEEQGYLVKIESHKHSVPFSDRGKVPVEPLLSTQWFVRMEPMASLCREHLSKDEPRFIPERWKKVYLDWLTEIRDWCISRQLWWGHRIPAWFVVSETKGQLIDSTPFVVARSEEEALTKAQQQFGNLVEIRQDEDVLDTWFSSGLWPFSTLGWPDESNPDFKAWYPTSTLVTGFDIIFFWVARMTMMAGAFTKKMPFANVYIHGLVRDENNQKMSKSAGNGIDPLLLIDKYGTDALRFALVREVAGSGQDIRLDFDRKKQTSGTVESARNFANKLWNATRFALMNLDQCSNSNIDQFQLDDLKLADKWILSRLTRVNKETSTRYENFALGEAAKGLYEFAWNDFCDWYLELIKPRLNINHESGLNDKRLASQILLKVLIDLLTMLHPLMPHLTEELWHALTGIDEKNFLALAKWPQENKQFLDENLEKSFAELIGAIRVVRNLRAVAGLKPSQTVSVIFVTGRSDFAKVLEKSLGDITTLTKASSIRVLEIDDPSAKDIENVLAGVSGELQVLLPLEGLVDINSLKIRLQKDLAKANKDISIFSDRLTNRNFAEKAPSKVVEECRLKLDEAKAQAELASKRLSDLN